MKKMLKKMLSRIFRLMFNFTARVFPIKKGVIIFESFNGKLPSDNPYAIYEEVVKKTEGSNCYWAIKKNFYHEATEKFPELTFVARFSWKWLWLTARANYWVFNARMPYWLRKNKQTIYIQTWHGTPLKKLGIDIENVSMPGTSTTAYQQNFTNETQRWDYLIAPNAYSKQIFERAFQFENTFLEIGYPRNDELCLYKDDIAYQEELRKKVVGTTKGKIILYAPTWRDDYYISKGNYKFFMPFKLEKILRILSEEDTLIIRPHYLVGDSIDIRGFEKQVKICMNENINDLYMISDLLITDYSSVMFDYALLNRPMLFYPYDFEHYHKELRGFYFDYQEVPGPIALNEEQFYMRLAEFIQFNKFKTCNEKLSSFHQKFGSWERGIASKYVAELIVDEEKL